MIKNTVTFTFGNSLTNVQEIKTIINQFHVKAEFKANQLILKGSINQLRQIGFNPKWQQFLKKHPAKHSKIWKSI